MMYKVQFTWYNDRTEEISDIYSIVAADSMSDAVKIIENQFDTSLETIEHIERLTDGYMYEFNSKEEYDKLEGY